MLFRLPTLLGGLTLISPGMVLAAPNPNNIVLNSGGQNFTLSSSDPITVAAGEPSPGIVPSSVPQVKALYFISNAQNSNAVIALKIAANGTLSYGSSTLTGGRGMNGIDGATNRSAAPDALFSQGAVAVAGNMLMAVNPGSNTMTMFNISPTDPTNLTRVGKPVDTQGEFPVSATISKKLNQACVANSGARAGLACFTITPSGLSPQNTTVQPISLNQTTPPIGPTNTISQVFFNAHSTTLMTTVKGNPALNTSGFLSITPITSNGLPDFTQETRTSLLGTAVLFGTANIPHNPSSLFVTDASFGIATLSLLPNHTASLISRVQIPKQKATCWATISPTTQTAFVTDVLVNRLVEVDPTTGEMIRQYDQLDNGNSGMIDLVAEGRFVYALSPGDDGMTRVVVFDVGGGRGTAEMVQSFVVNGVGAGAQGMAAFSF